jgi:hypothetical protein
MIRPEPSSRLSGQGGRDEFTYRIIHNSGFKNR